MNRASEKCDTPLTRPSYAKREEQKRREKRDRKKCFKNEWLKNAPKFDGKH